MNTPTPHADAPELHHQLWAPWRLQYIAPGEAVKRPACFLCQARDDNADAVNYVVHRGERSIVVLNRYPYSNGHLLIAPLAHKASPLELDDAELLDGLKEMRRMIAALTRLMNPEGFNVGLNLGKVAGAGLPGHLHWHIVPRWNGDTNFMPVLADTSVIPQSLDALHQLLVRELAAEPA